MSGDEKKDLYVEVTDRIVSDLEKGIRTWSQPWNAGPNWSNVSLPLRHNGIPYRGVNILLLWMEAALRGFSCPIWMTFQQALQHGGHVRKRERGSLVVFANRVAKTDTNEAGEDVERNLHLLKRYTVFNVEQIDGLNSDWYIPPPNPLLLSERLEAVDAFTKATAASIHHGGNRAFYAPSRDIVQMPFFETFKEKESYYSTLLHELTHWTKHTSRLNREFGPAHFGNSAYANEELVAELGAAFLCAELGITPEIREDHAGYIAHWLEILKEDKRAIFRAAAHAQRAVTFLKALQPEGAMPQAEQIQQLLPRRISDASEFRPE